MSWIVVHYQEIGIKGRNRVSFERALMRHVEAVLGGKGAVRLERRFGRLIGELDGRLAAGEVERRLACVPGVAHFALASLAPLDLDAICEHALQIARREGGQARSFRIDTRRSNKAFPHTSVETNQRLGRAVAEATGLAVDLERPDLRIWVELTEREALLYGRRHPGLGGLPMDTAGRVLALLSGGIDSPVAAFRVMRRGARVLLVHFHNYSRYQDQVRSKLLELAGVLNRYQLGTRLYLVPFAEIQTALVAAIPAPERMVAYRRAMFRVGELIRQAEGAQAFVTGDSLGQVASQTLANLAAIHESSQVPVLSPLITLDKQDIVAEARRIGSYQISIRPYDDCCSFLVARHPRTSVNLPTLIERECPLPLDELGREAVARAEIHDYPEVWGGQEEEPRTSLRREPGGQPTQAVPPGDA